MSDPMSAISGRSSIAADAPETLILDFLEWLSPSPRPYAEVMERWRTSCPRLTVWEDAVDRGLVARRRSPPGPAVVELTSAGHDVLAATRRSIVGREGGQAEPRTAP